MPWTSFFPLQGPRCRKAEVEQWIPGEIRECWTGSPSRTEPCTHPHKQNSLGVAPREPQCEHTSPCTHHRVWTIIHSPLITHCKTYPEHLTPLPVDWGRHKQTVTYHEAFQGKHMDSSSYRGGLPLHQEWKAAHLSAQSHWFITHKAIAYNDKQD